MKLKPWTFLKQFLTKNIIILVILSNIIPVFYFFLCIHYNKFAVDSIIYNLSQFTSIQIKFFLFYGVFYGLVLINNILLKKNINTMTNQFVNECLLKFNNKKNYNENLIFTLFNNLKNNYKNFFQDGVNFVGNISMIFTVNYIIYQFNVPYLLWSFIGFFVIKVIFNFYLYKKNLFIEKSNHYQNKSNNYWNNIIENYNLLKMFNCKKLIINNLEVKQNEAIKYENLSNIFKEILDFVFNNLDIFQWVINNILIFKFTPQQYLLARLFNIGLINWFYRDLLIKINYQLPALINYYQLLAINYNDLLENEEITKESPLINLNGNYNIAIKELTIDHQVILKNIFIDINNIKKQLNKSYINLGIIGLSGSGKSSLLKCIMNFIPIDGTITFDSENHIIDHTKLSTNDYLKNILYMGQNKYIFQDTLKNNIILKADNCLDSMAIEKILDILNIKKDLHEEISNNTLSGGEKSRINMARSIINSSHPRLIIMDELEASLDDLTYKNIYKFIMDNYPINKIISTHDIPTIMALDYIIFLDNGTIIMEGTPQTMLENPIFYNLINENNNIK